MVKSKQSFEKIPYNLLQDTPYRLRSTAFQLFEAPYEPNDRCARVVVSLPSCPTSFAPDIHIVPFAFIAAPLLAPVIMSTQSVLLEYSCTGLDTATAGIHRHPSPTIPHSLYPHPHKVLSSLRPCKVELPTVTLHQFVLDETS